MNILFSKEYVFFIIHSILKAVCTVSRYRDILFNNSKVNQKRGIHILYIDFTFSLTEKGIHMSVNVRSS